MVDNISLGKGRKAQQLDLAKMQQGGIIREAKDEKNESIFSDDEKKIFDAVDKNGGKANGVLDKEELNKFLEDLKDAAGNGRLSKREANKFLKEHGLKDIDPKTLFSFVDKISQSSENIKSCQMDAEGNIIIEYNDDKTETINSENQTSTIQSNDGKITEEYNAARELTKKTVKENETDSTTTEYSGVDKDGNPIPTKETVISDENKTTTTTTFENGKKTEVETSKNNGEIVTTTTLDENEKPKTEVETQGAYTVINREYVDGEARVTSRIDNKGLDTQKDSTYEYTKDGFVIENSTELGGAKKSITITKDNVLISKDIVEIDKSTRIEKNNKGGYTENITEGSTVTQNELNSEMNRLSQTKQVGTKQYQLAYDGTGNTTGIIVQNGESPAVIAKKFGVPLDKLLEANADKLNGKKYFAVGEEIKIPREMEADEKVLQGRKDAQGAKAEYAQEQARIQAEREARRQRIQAERAARRQQIAAENKIYKQLGIKNRKGAGTTIKDNKGNKYTVVGQAGFERTIAKDKKGNIHVIAHDGVDLKTSYVAADIAFVRAGKKRIVVRGRAYYTDGAARDRHGRMNVTDWTGRTAILSGGKSKTDLSDRVILHKGYVQASDARDAAKDAKQEQGTFSEGNNVTQYKDDSGKIWYFDEKTGKALVKGQYSNFVNQEAQAISESIYDAAKGIGTKNEQLERAVNYIQSPEMFAKVNAHIAPKNSDYTPTADTTALEALILDENDHGTAQGYFRTLINNGAMTTSQAGACVARELEHELHGRTFGYTSTEGVNRVMNLCHDRNVRLEVESQLAAKHPELKANEGSITRAYLADDGWNPQEVDQFDANWVANNAYTQATYKKDENGQIVRDKDGNPIIEDMGDQAHRNGVISRLSFDYEDKEALHKGLKAMNDNPDSQDYICFAQRAVEENQKRNYKQQFTDQECVQQYLAGRATDDGQVDVEQLSACNNLLFKSEKPARVRAEESLYGAKNGDMSHVFDSMDPEVYDAQQEIFAKGDIKGCKNVQDAYNKAMAQARADQKVSIKANAILSKQVKFSQKEITDFTIELMHSIDSSTGAGASTHQSGSNTTDAEYKTEQLKAILTDHPEIINDVKAMVEKGDFSFDVTRDSGEKISFTDHYDNKQKYLDIINNTNTAAKDAIFYDEKGNKITDPAQIEALTKANMNSLQGLRQYVAELERDFKMGVDEEGAFSDAANALVEYSGLGTGRGEVANNYRYAKNLLKQLELAAQGKLRDSSGKVISAQELAKKVQNDIGNLSQANADYKSSISRAKMGMVLAPVIVVTTVATGGGALAGWGSAATVAGATTAVVEGSIQATELLTSETGNTAENRASATQQVLWDTALAATGTKIGQLSERMVQSGLKMTSAAAERMLIQEGLNANAARLISKSPNAVSTVLKRAEEITAKLQQTKLNQVMTAAGDKFVDAGAGLISKQTALLNKVAPNLNPETARKVSVILARSEAAGFEVTSDSVQSLVQMYCQEGKFDEASFTQGMIMSIAGNTIGHITSGVGDLRPQTKPQVDPQGVLEHATGNGSHPSGGKLNAEKMEAARQQVADVAQHGTPQEVAHVHNEADLQQAQSRPQGRELKHVIEYNAGFVAIGKERIALDSSDFDALARAKKEVSNWADGTRDKEAILAKINKRMDEITAGQVKPTEPARGVDVVEHINDKVNQNAEHILDGNTGAIGSHDAATLRDQLANNLKSEGEIEQFIADIKQRVGVDEKGNMHVYQVQGKDHAADLVNAAEKKLKDIKANKANFEEASSILDKANAAGKGLSEDELKTLKSVAGKMTDSESLQSLIDKMKSNKKIKGHSGAKKAIAEMEAQVQTLKKAEAGHVQKAQTAEEPQGASDGSVADFAAEQNRMIAEGKLNPDGTPIETQPKAKPDETPIETQPKAKADEAPATHNVEEPQGVSDKPVADFAAEQKRMIAEGKLNPDGTPIETQPKVKADETPAVRNASEQKVSDAPANSAEVKQAAVEVELTPQKVAGMKKEAVALDKEIKASSEIPAQQKHLWTSVKEKYEVLLDSVKSMKDGAKSSALVKYGKEVLQGLQSIAKTAPKAIKQKLAKMAKNIQALMKTLTVQSSPNRGVLGTNPKLDKYVVNPNKPAMKISQEAKELARDYGTTPEHVQFYMDNKELFKGNTMWDCWSGFEPKNQKHGAWKMHMYSVDEKDWQKMSEVLIPYLRDHDIDWKTFNIASGADHLNGGIQEGKAFTIYPRDNAHMEQVAKDLDYIIRNNNLETSGSNIVGDRAMGDNGRLFYRYEYNTGAVKDEVLDLAKATDKDKYFAIYDSNSGRVNRHGEGRYLADDMSAADDPWLNFNPADPKSHATYNRNNINESPVQKAERLFNDDAQVIFAEPVIEGHYTADNFKVGDKLPKDQGVIVASNAKLLLADQVELDLSSPKIQSKLKNLKDGQSLTIGREGDIVVGANNSNISRKHLTIEKSGNEIIVKDISTNGTKFSSLGDEVQVVPVEPGNSSQRVNNSQDIIAEPVIEAYFTADNFKVGDKLPKDQGVIVASNAKLLLADQVELDLSSPKIQSKLKNLKDGQSLTIGREGDIVVGANNSNISRKHLTIEKSGNEIIVKDISTNGTKFSSLGDEVQVVSAEPVNNSRRSNNSNFQGLSEDIKSTFSENTQQNLKKLKNGQSVSLTKGDRHYVVKNNNGQIVIETSLDANELVRVKGNNGKEINSNYVQTSIEAREYLQDAIESGQYTDSFESYVQTMNNMHKVSATGRNGNNEWYSQAGNGSNSVNPGQIRGSGSMVNHRTNTAIEAEEIAKQYGDSYRVETTKSQVNLKGIPDKYKPTDYNYGEHAHQYPDGDGLGYYYKEMHRTAKETLDLINNGASEQKILKKIAEHYQYAANARPYGQINNSLFMNEINTLLQKAGLKTIPHGNLDQISMHLQPETFQKYFIDQYYQTAL